MIPVLSREQMRAFDAHVIRDCRVPGLVLMENAGRGATDALCADVLPRATGGAHVIAVCGAGNNGGDGLVVARHLRLRGVPVTVVLAGDPARMPADARANLEAWRGVGGAVHELSVGAAEAEVRRALHGARVLVDGLFGTGLDRPIEGWLATVIAMVNGAHAPRFALDLPSGLDADRGVALGVAVEADATATFAFLKRGLLTPVGARLAGRVRVVDIGAPPSLVSHVGPTAQKLEASDLARWLAPRTPGAHKTSAGHVVVVGGSEGRVGAPQLVARGALRAGAGLVTIATWARVAAAIEAGVLEAMTARLDPARPGDGLDPVLRAARAVAVGPGLGLGDDARALVEHLLAWTGPKVIDADALTLCAGRTELLRAARETILTPHPGEAARLLESSAAAVEGDRYGAARDLVAATGAVVVLKGAHTIIASPDGRIAVSPVACPALATAGSGDVLGGIVAAAACSLPPFEAACAGVLRHARAGEAWSRAHGGADRGMMASEIADGLTHEALHEDG